MSVDLEDALEWEHYKTGKYWHHAVAGASAGVCEHLIMYPFDTIKTNLQAERPDQARGPVAAACSVSSSEAGGTSGCSSSSSPASTSTASGRTACASRPNVGGAVAAGTASKGSNSTFFGKQFFSNAAVAGTGSTSGGPTLQPYTGTSAACSSTSRRGVLPPAGGGGGVTAAFGGSIVHPGGGAAGATLAPPAAARYSNTWTAFQAIRQDAGWAGFYRGVSAMALGCIPAHIGYFCAYEAVKSGAGTLLSSGGTSIISSSAGGGASATTASGAPRGEAVVAPASAGSGGGGTVQGRGAGTGTPPSATLKTSSLAGSLPRLAQHPQQPDNTWLVGGLAGCAASFFHDLILTPLDVAKQRMQLRPEAIADKSCADCVKHVIRTEGYWALYRSFPVTFFANAPFAAIMVSCNEQLKESFHLNTTCQSWDEMRAKLPLYFSLAGASSGVAAICTQPLDVIKTRIQTQTCLLNRSADRVRYRGILDAAKTLLLEEGGAALFKGSVARALVVIPSCAISWASYETIKSFFVRNDF